jgi:hypothetical protein
VVCLQRSASITMARLVRHLAVAIGWPAMGSIRGGGS